MAVVIGRYWPGRVVEHRRRDRARPLELGEEGVELLRRDGAAEPAEAGEEHELQLRDDRAGEPDEQVVEATVGEVVLDPGAADPADAPVDDEQLAVVDAPGRPPRTRTSTPRTPRPQPLVEATRPAGPRADPVDHDPHRDPFGDLGEQRARELLPDLAGAEAVLVDWTEDVAPAMSARIRGKNSRPETWTSTLAAADSSKVSARSLNWTGERANRSARARTSFMG